MKLLPVILAYLVATLAFAEPGFQTPSPVLQSVIDAPAPARLSLSPDKSHIALLERSRTISLEELTNEELKLAGIRINPANLSRSRRTGYLGLSIRPIDSQAALELEELPKGKIASTSWSPDSKHLAILLETSNELQLWSYAISTPKPTKLLNTPLNGSTISSPFTWLRDSSGLIVNLRVNAREQKPQASEEQVTPIISETLDGVKAPNRTFQDLLKTPLDKDLLDHFCTGQLAVVRLDGSVSKIASPALYTQFSLSPNGEYILLKYAKRPYSYIVPLYRFPSVTDVYRLDGTFVSTIADLPLAEDIPKGFDSVRLGRRSISWRNDAAATLFWAETQDGGSMKTEVDYHDHIYQQAAPFDSQPELLAKTEWRYSNITWGSDDLALLTEWRFSDRKLKTWKIDPSDPQAKPSLFDHRGYRDAYKDPGTPIMVRNDYGTRVMHIGNNGQEILLRGTGASPKGNIPFLDKHSFATGEKERIWVSEAPYYERVIDTLDTDTLEVLTLRESSDEPANYYKRSIKTGSLKVITQFPHPFPEFRGIDKEIVKYQRPDGVELSGKLYLPNGYDPKKDGPIPVLMWAYPREYKDASVAGQMRESPHAFKFVSYYGPLPFLSKGYAVFDDVKMPIIGLGEDLPNDSFRDQLVANAQAAIDTLVERGIADPKRIAIGGHSYGAFMVANLLAHSDLFATGIARSGAYNRSLTPFGFQGEERDFWEGQSVYAAMSPFFHADKIDEPLLMIHGKEDNNSGTYPMQSERMFNALKGLGGTARLVMLPYESHGYRARESLLHMMWEQEQWLEKHL